ncbi:MAG: glycosyltransferase [Anaerolineales bacterium]|nr:glycosyltransferase [Anaerolineales bacterium]
MISQRPEISVLMPCYNTAETLDAALESIHAQTHIDFEVIAVNDGSTDGTLDVLRSWESRDSRVHILNQPHQGIIQALNTGLRHCKAALIARMDGDDLVEPTRFTMQRDFLNENEDITVVSCLVQGYPEEDVREGYRLYIQWLNSLITPEDIAREIFIESPLAHPSVMMRKSWLERVGGYQEHGWPEDYDLWLRMHIMGAKFAKVPEVLLSWRERAGRLTRTDPRYSVENFIRAKAYYLLKGPLKGRNAVILWGAGQMGRRLSKHLVRGGAPLSAFIDIDPSKIGSERRGRPILPPEELPALWNRSDNPVVLAAVGSRGARELIREQLTTLGLREAVDWWAVA